MQAFESQPCVESTSRMLRSGAICSQPRQDFQPLRQDQDDEEEGAVPRSSVSAPIPPLHSNSELATNIGFPNRSSCRQRPGRLGLTSLHGFLTIFEATLQPDSIFSA